MRYPSEQSAWEVSQQDFPLGGSLSERLAFAVRYALLAPSSHNAQPWLFRQQGEAVELWADRARALPVCDPDDRELTISCGAALALLELALRHAGSRVSTELLPAGASNDLLARLQVTGEAPPTPLEERLFEAIVRRRTHRSPFTPAALPPGLAGDLALAAHEAGCWLQPVGVEQRPALAELVTRADRLQMADPRFRRELAAWLHPNRSRSRDGMPGSAFGLADVTAVAGPWVLRHLDLGRLEAWHDRASLESAPLLAVLTHQDTPAGWLSTGRALAHVLLAATAEGVSAAFFNGPAQLDLLREELRSALALPGDPQLVLAFGRASARPPTPRRALEDVLVP